MFQKALIVTALGFLLSKFGPIDDWYGLNYSEEYTLHEFNVKNYGKNLKFKRKLHICKCELDFNFYRLEKEFQFFAPEPYKIGKLGKR